jgi:tetratricopeptide (TPR) repeat protein
MKKTLLSLALFGSLLLGCSPKNIPQTATIVNQEALDRDGYQMLIGVCTKASMLREPYKNWYEPTYNTYQLDTLLLKKLKPNPETDTFTIFMATWCGDSQNEVPKFLKMMRYLNVPQANYKIVMVDNQQERYKQSPTHEERGQNIFRVPTFIINRNGQEIGRIVEHPVDNFEKDFTKIMNGEAYFSSFKIQPKMHEFIENQKVDLSDIALKQFAETHKSLANKMGELNAYGYVLLGQKRYKEAIAVLKINTLLFPENDGTYDSLGEAYMIVGKKDLAILNYEKAVKLNPKADGSRRMLEKLRG